MTKNSGLADSPFFSLRTDSVPTPPVEETIHAVTPPPPEHVSPPSSEAQATHKDNETNRKKKTLLSKKVRNRDVMTSRNHEVTMSLHHDVIPPGSEDIISQLRSIVKQIGKEPTTCRLTTEEKNLLKDVEYEYRKRGITTSGNEILRIAMNFLVDDYKEHGEQSILDKVLKALNE